MNKIIFPCVFAALIGISAVYAQTDESARDHIKIEKTTTSGAKVTVVEGTDAPANGDRAQSVRGTADSTPHKARLAVLPAVFSSQFKLESSVQDKIETSGQVDLKMVFTTDHEARMQAPSFTLSLTEAFVDSRKFDVLERTRLNETLKEIDFGESAYADVSKVVPMGKALNAEYVALPDVEVIHLVQEVKDVPYVDTVQPRLKGKMIARLRVVDTAGSKIVAACTEDVQIERKLKADDPFLATEVNNLVIDLYKTMSLRMMHRTMEAVYPVRILEVDGGKVVLNRGEGAISVGDEFEIYSLGKAYVDQDTGESLGQGESKVAVIKVTQVAPKFSQAEIVDGADHLTGDSKNYLCRETAKSIEAKTKLDEKPMAW
ncbi:MAG: hypothetical protein V1929_02660 [bacterium]